MQYSTSENYYIKRTTKIAERAAAIAEKGGSITTTVKLDLRTAFTADVAGILDKDQLVIDEKVHRELSEVAKNKLNILNSALKELEATLADEDIYFVHKGIEVSDMQLCVSHKSGAELSKRLDILE